MIQSIIIVYVFLFTLVFIDVSKVETKMFTVNYKVSKNCYICQRNSDNATVHFLISITKFVNLLTVYFRGRVVVLSF